MDAIIINSALAAGNHAVSLLRGVADSLKSLGKAEIINQLIEAQLAMMQLLQKYQEVQSENHELIKKTKELEDKLAFQAKLTFKSPYYFAESDPVPFCPQCWEASKLPVHLQPADTESYDHVAVRHCLNCDQSFSTPKS